MKSVKYTRKELLDISKLTSEMKKIMRQKTDRPLYKRFYLNLKDTLTAIQKSRKWKVPVDVDGKSLAKIPTSNMRKHGRCL